MVALIPRTMRVEAGEGQPDEGGDDFTHPVDWRTAPNRNCQWPAAKARRLESP
jgi:hypothetical protein